MRVSTAMPRAAVLPRLLPEDGNPEDIRSHLARHGRIPYRGGRGTLIRDVEQSGLVGRGGASFPAHRKLSSVLDNAVKRRVAPVIVANGAEGEPASSKDAALLGLAPHLVLDGIQLAAEAVGAGQAFLYTHSTRLGEHVRQALAQRHDDLVTVEVVTAPPRFLAGQETALVSHLNGGPAVPAFSPPRPGERGVSGLPTLVQNVETLGHLALIARYGPHWFREIGIRNGSGSLLCTVRRPDGRPRVFEVPFGLPLQDLLGGPERIGAVLLGGYHGTWVHTGQALRLRLDNDSLSAVGASVGAGIVVALPADACGLIETARSVRYLALESAGQCGPCLNGLPRISAALTDLARCRADRRALGDLQRWSGLVAGRGVCHHPDGTVRFVRSALETFAGEVERHMRGQCGAMRREPFLPVPADVARTEEDWL